MELTVDAWRDVDADVANFANSGENNSRQQAVRDQVLLLREEWQRAVACWMNRDRQGRGVSVAFDTSETSWQESQDSAVGGLTVKIAFLVRSDDSSFAAEAPTFSSSLAPTFSFAAEAEKLDLKKLLRHTLWAANMMSSFPKYGDQRNWIQMSKVFSWFFVHLT